MLLLPTLLNASLTTTSPNPEPSGPHTLVYCFGQQPQLMPLTWVACKEAITKIPLSDAGLKPISFGRSEDAGFQVPYTWESRGCIVEIDVVSEDVTETATFLGLLVVADAIAKECVIKPPHMGGRAEVGDENGLQIGIYGLR